MDKILCLIAYLLSLPGIIIARIAGAKNPLCLYHVRRALELFLFDLFLVILWYVITYLFMLIPYAGFPIAMSLFGVVIAGFAFTLILRIRGIIKAFRGRQYILPLVSGLMGKFEKGFRLLGLQEDKE